MKYFFIILILLIPQISFCQNNIELKRSDKLTGKTIDNQTVREATGNVYFIRGNVNVYCNSALQYIDLNKVELTGDVKIYQDTLSLFTQKAIYYGNENKAIFENGITLKDPNATINADGGTYYFNEAKATFAGNVRIDNPDYRITSTYMIYLRNTEDSFARDNVVVKKDSATIKAENIDFYKRQGKTFAYKNVSIEKDSSIITSDTLTDYSFEKKSIAVGNVEINNLRNNALIFGKYLENYEKTKYSFIRGKAKLVQIDKDKDTMFVYCDTMESFREIPERYIAKDSVEIIRKNFFSKCGYSVYSKTLDTTLEKMSLYRNPIVWQDNMQLTGDTIYADLKERKLQTIYSNKIDELPNSKYSFLILENRDSLFSDRYDQIRGKDIIIHFDSNKVNYVDVKKNSSSIYFMYEDRKANGVNIVDGMNMVISFDSEQKADKVKVEIRPKGKYVPEVQLNTVTLELPGFLVRTDLPMRR